MMAKKPAAAPKTKRALAKTTKKAAAKKPKAKCAQAAQPVKSEAVPEVIPRLVYSDELAAEICAGLLNRSDGGRINSLRDVCAADGMPCESTAYKWLTQHDTFAEMYARAREIQADMSASDIPYIADTEEDANRARVRIDARKWWTAKVSPRKYGDKTQIEATGKDGKDLIPESKMDDLELARYVAGLLTSAAKQQEAESSE